MPDAAPPPPQGLRAIQALFAPLAGAAHEVAACAYLDRHWRLLGLRHVPGARHWLSVPIRTLAADALAFEAVAAVMAHNHPSGDPTPSNADFAFTRLLGRTFEAMGITLLDHLVLASDRVVSLREQGYL